MKAIRNVATLFATAALAAALGASLASAQDFHGKFTLPFEARWGTATLPPGDYTIQVSHTPVGMGKIELRGETKGGARAFVFSAIDATSPSLGKSALVCIRQGATGTVRALELRPLNETMYFDMPKGAQIYAQKRSGQKNKPMAEAPELIERLPVSVVSK